MKIVLVIDQFDDSNNGTTVTARRFAGQLRRRGHEVVILAGGAPCEGKICAPVHRIPVFQKLIESQGMCFAKPDEEAYYTAFKDADIVHFYMPFRFCRRGEELARQMGIPTVAAFHVQPENITSSIFLGKNRRVNDFLYWWFYKVFYNRFDHIHCPSAFIARQLESHGYGAKLWVISNGVADAFRPAQVPRAPELEGRFTILMIGRLSGEKRQDLIIEAAKRSKYADRLQLVFAGKGPKEKAYPSLPRGWRIRPCSASTARTSCAGSSICATFTSMPPTPRSRVSAVWRRWPAGWCRSSRIRRFPPPASSRCARRACSVRATRMILRAGSITGWSIRRKNALMPNGTRSGRMRIVWKPVWPAPRRCTPRRSGTSGAKATARCPSAAGGAAQAPAARPSGAISVRAVQCARCCSGCSPRCFLPSCGCWTAFGWAPGSKAGKISTPCRAVRSA